MVVSNTRGSQGTVLSPFLFNIYTTGFRYNSDSTIVGSISEEREAEYRDVFNNFVGSCGLNHPIF